MPATRQATRSSKGNLNPKPPGKLSGKSKSPASRAGGNQRRAAAAPNSQTPDGTGASGGIADALDLESLGRPSGIAPKGPIPLSPLVQGAPGRPAVPNPLADQDGRYAREGPRPDRHANADGSPDANAGDKASSDGPLRVNVPEEPVQPVETAPAATPVPDEQALEIARLREQLAESQRALQEAKSVDVADDPSTSDEDAYYLVPGASLFQTD